MKPWEYGPLEVSENGKYLRNGEKPFFWLGDTAWMMFSHLNEEEAGIYLRNRKEKGYNVIQITLIHEWPQKNRDGARALRGDDFADPDREGGYWQRVEVMVEMAERLGLYVALLPAWGGHVKEGRLKLQNAESYLSFLVERFGEQKNVIWLVGGDVKGEAAFDVFCYIGAYLKEHTRDQLVGFHPFGRTSSSRWFQDEQWLDFHMFQSGHRRYDQRVLNAWDDNGNNPDNFGEDNWRYVERDLKIKPVRPVIDGEPSYEQVLQGLHDETQPYWQSWDTRRYAYWSVFAGAFGHTFGDNAVMQFFDRERDKKGAFGVRQDWREALHNTGGACMCHLRTLMESVDFTNGRDRNELVTEGQGEQYGHISVFAGDDYVLAYDYDCHEFTLDLSGYGREFEAFWMDPVTGVSSYFGMVSPGRCRFRPAGRQEGHSDWVLVLRSISR